MNTIKLKIDRNPNGSTNINSEPNRETLDKYIVPIIANNPGWGSGHVTADNIWSLPQGELQNLLDATVGPHADSCCWVLIDNSEPVGLFQASVTTPAENYSNTISAMLADSANQWWQIAKTNPGDLLPGAKHIFATKTLYSSYGIALAPKFQGQHTPYASKLYSLASDDILFGWTSNPSVVAKHRKTYPRTYYYPLFGQAVDSPEALVSVILLCASFSNWSNDSWKTLEFGAAEDKYFVEDRGEEYIVKAKQFARAGTITDLDAKRVEYVLSQKFCASGIVSIS